MSLATKRSIRPSLLMSVATTPKPFPKCSGDGGSLAHFGKGAVAVVVVKKTGGGLENSRNAIVVSTEFVIAALQLAHSRVVHKAADE